MNAPWLFAEAYKYRRLHECFSVSKHWKDYDVFYRQKVYPCNKFNSAANHHSQRDTFSRSAEAVFELSMRFAEPFKQPENITGQEKTEAERLMFLELTQGLCLTSTNYSPSNFYQFACGGTPLTCHCSST